VERLQVELAAGKPDTDGEEVPFGYGPCGGSSHG
jgi:hypothetical protein